VALQRKLRDLVDTKDSPLWKELAAEMSLSEENFDILESKQTKRADVRRLSSEELLKKYWDV
jgi:hypothetical protein